MKLSLLQLETMAYCRERIDAAQKGLIEGSIFEDLKNGFVYTQGGKCTIRTLRKLEKLGLVDIIEDNTGIGTGGGAFPTKIKVLDLTTDYKNLYEEAKNNEKAKPKKNKKNYKEVLIEKTVMGFNGPYIDHAPFQAICDDEGNVLTDLGLLKDLYDYRFKNILPVMITNKALVSMATYKPKSMEEFVCLDGLGEKTYLKCGKELINEIKRYLGNN